MWSVVRIRDITTLAPEHQQSVIDGLHLMRIEDIDQELSTPARPRRCIPGTFDSLGAFLEAVRYTMAGE